MSVIPSAVRRLPLVLSLALLVSAAPAHAQAPKSATPAATPTPPATTVLPATGVEVVRVEVVVHEKKGRPKEGLRREDFEVLEDGKPQSIVQFQAFARPGQSVAPEPTAPTAAAEEETPEGEAQLPARYVVLAIDDVHMEFESLVRTRKALERFLDEDLRPEDQVAMVTTSGARALSQEFTSDRAVLRQVLSRLSAQGRSAEWTGIPHISEYQAEMIEAGDPMALDAAVQEILQSGILQDADSATQEATHKAHRVLTEAVYNARLTLETLESLCRGLSGLTGRKSLFLVSDGFITGIASGSGSAYDLRRIADAGMRAGVVIYSLDTHGLSATPMQMRAESPLKIGPATSGSIEAMARRSEEAVKSAMNSIAADTGGFLVDNTNDLRSGLRTILKDTETYYVLAYEPTNTKRDGSFRRIEVRVPAVHGVKVRTRSGYFAADERRMLANATKAELARRDEQRRAEMGAALTALAPLTSIPVRVAADFVSRDGSGGGVVVNGSVDVSGLPFVRRDERRLATVETAAIVLDDTGQVAATLETERRSLDLTEAEVAKLARQGLPYSRTVALKPGRYQVRLAVRDDATGLLGSAWRWIEVPDLSAGRLSLSGLFLMKDDGPSTAAAAGSTPAGGATPSLRSVQDLPRYGRGEKLYVQLQAYNAKRDPSGAIDLVFQASVLRDGAPLATAAPETMETGAATGPVAHVARIGLRPFEPGDYELRITVTDRKASAAASRVVPFTVE